MKMETVLLSSLRGVTTGKTIVVDSPRNVKELGFVKCNFVGQKNRKHTPSDLKVSFELCENLDYYLVLGFAAEIIFVECTFMYKRDSIEDDGSLPKHVSFQKCLNLLPQRSMSVRDKGQVEFVNCTFADGSGFSVTNPNVEGVFYSDNVYPKTPIRDRHVSSSASIGLYGKSDLEYLNPMLSRVQGPVAYTFTGYPIPGGVVQVTCRNAEFRFKLDDEFKAASFSRVNIKLGPRVQHVLVGDGARALKFLNPEVVKKLTYVKSSVAPDPKVWTGVTHLVIEEGALPDAYPEKMEYLRVDEPPGQWVSLPRLPEGLKGLMVTCKEDAEIIIPNLPSTLEHLCLIGCSFVSTKTLRSFLGEPRPIKSLMVVRGSNIPPLAQCYDQGRTLQKNIRGTQFIVSAKADGPKTDSVQRPMDILRRLQSQNPLTRRIDLSLEESALFGAEQDPDYFSYKEVWKGVMVSRDLATKYIVIDYGNYDAVNPHYTWRLHKELTTVLKPKNEVPLIVDVHGQLLVEEQIEKQQPSGVAPFDFHPWWPIRDDDGMDWLRTFAE